MPVEIFETTDPITALVQFRTSAIYEMLVSLDTLLKARRHLDWVQRTRAALGPDFMAELLEIQNGCFLLDAEAAVDFPDHHDVPGFIAYVRNMDPATFVFYLIGRVVPLEQIRAINIDVDRMMKHVNAYYDGRNHSLDDESGLRKAISNAPAYQTRLTALWEHYWNTIFQEEIPQLSARWAAAIAEKERVLARDGGQAMLELITNKNRLPDPLPSDHPFTEVVCVPVYYISSQSFWFFGYGNTTILFDSERTEARITEVNRAKEESLEIIKALADSTRLGILRVIAQYGDEMHGKKIAHQLNLSPSAVSRQLAQLRDGGLIAEEHHDNQTVTYRLNKEALTSLPDKILDYLYN